MNILSKDILPLKTSQKFSSVLEPYAGKVASTVLRRECHCEVMFLSDYILNTYQNFIINYTLISYLTFLPCVPSICFMHPNSTRAVISLTAVALLTFVKEIYFFVLSPPLKFSFPTSNILFKTFICLSFRALLLCLSQNFVFCIIFDKFV